MAKKPTYEELEQRVKELEEENREVNRQNITSRKQAEEAMLANEAQKKAILDGITVNLAFVNKDLELLWANKAAVDSVCKTPDAMIGCKCYELWANPLKPCEGCPTLKAFKTKKTEQAIMHTPDGKVWEEKGEPVFDGKGELIGVLEIAHDITAKAQVEKSLRESEEKYRGLIEGLDEAVYRMSLPDGKYEYMSPAAKKVFGYSAEKFIEDPLIIGKLVHPDFAEYFEEKWADLIEGKVSPTYKYKILDPEGNERWIVQSNTGIFDDRGNIIGIEGLCRDITKGVRAEEVLRESEERLSIALDASNSAMWDFNPHTLSDTNYNDRWFTMLGYEPDELPRTAETWTKLMHPEDLGRVQKKLQDHIEGKNEYSNEFRMKRKDGRYCWVYSIGGIVSWDKEGNPQRMVGIHIDISDRKRAEKALLESEEKYRTILESIDDGYFEVDIAGNFTFFNDSLCKILGYSKDELMGMNNRQYTDEENAKKLYQTFNKAYTTGKPDKGFGWKILRKDGTKRVVDASVSLRSGARGEPIGFRGIVRDISEKQILEIQLQKTQKMEAIGTLAGGIAHDFNNILGSIILLSEISLLDTPEGSSLHRHIAQILGSGMRAKALVQQILTFSRQKEQEYIPMSIYPVINEALKLVRSSLPTTVEIRHYIKKDLGLILGDPTQIHQILVNLCTNAEHAMREKGGVLDVKLGGWDVDEAMAALHQDLQPGPHIGLEVKDTGKGIAPENRDRVFDPYFTTKGLGEGTGLGLAVVRGIVHKHGGAIIAESEPGKGTTFQVFFPVIEGEKEETGEKSEAPLPTGTERILFVDDEEVLAEVAKNILELLGYKVTIKTNSTEALELFKLEPDFFNLVITDMSMPDMTGEQLSREFMKIRPELPIILCTGFSHIISKEKAHEIGIKAFAMKPLIRKDLAETVRRVLDQAGASRFP